MPKQLPAPQQHPKPPSAYDPEHDYHRPYVDGMTGPHFYGGIPNLRAVRWARRVLIVTLLVAAVCVVALIG